MAKKKRKMRRSFFLKEPESVIVTPPAARLGAAGFTPGIDEGGVREIPWKELFQDSEAQCNSLTLEKRELQSFAQDLSNITLALTKMLIDEQHPAVGFGNTITIPDWLIEQTRGASLETGHAPTGEKMVRLLSRGSSHIEPGS